MKTEIEHKSNGLCCGPTYIYKTKLERYARFLELYIRFDVYNKMTAKQRKEKKEAAQKSTKDRRQEIKDTALRSIREKAKKDEAEITGKPYFSPYACTGSTISNITFPKDHCNIYVIPDCFICGAAPCDCPERWKEFLELGKEFGYQHIPPHSKVICTTSLLGLMKAEELNIHKKYLTQNKQNFIQRMRKKLSR